MKYKKIIIGMLSLALLNSHMIYANEISVSGNGDGSSSNVTITSSQDTQTSQQNNAEINNTVNESANTGNNTANNNSGNTTITTGDVNETSNITNNNINNSYVTTGCCQNGANLDISGNGSNSKNSIDYSTNTNTNVDINNNAQIANNVNGYGNTGKNTANKNLGNVSIKTGSVYVADNIHNNGINAYIVHAGNGGGGDVSITIDGNGADSTNSVMLADSHNVTISANNNANITNNSDWYLNTGDNDASDNNGNVSITTGDVIFASTIDNSANTGWVDIECCEQSHHNPPPPPPPPPPTTGGSECTNNCSTASNYSSSSNPSTSGQPVLPVTGSDTMLFLMIGNIVMFFLGGYLRLRSGRSPNYLFAK